MNKKNYIPRPSEVFSRDAKLVQHSKINQCNLQYQQANDKKKLYDRIN